MMMMMIFVYRPVVFNYRGRGGATLKVIFHCALPYITFYATIVCMVMLWLKVQSLIVWQALIISLALSRMLLASN